MSIIVVPFFFSVLIVPFIGCTIHAASYLLEPYQKLLEDRISLVSLSGTYLQCYHTFYARFDSSANCLLSFPKNSSKRESS
ncbi:hypothetical protein L6452_21462 [Arctium lappa]|uniref:Uncharacterized protein n=1 Tax=Arctium lappa TaxID=4217 RepID=A0ACB9AXC4_ARCLA|nr:hypothetical protein L6452_21462 [Arctium lappa]